MIVHQELITYACAGINFGSIYMICNNKKPGFILWITSLIYLAADMGIHKHYPMMMLMFSYLGLTFYSMFNNID